MAPRQCQTGAHRRRNKDADKRVPLKRRSARQARGCRKTLGEPGIPIDPPAQLTHASGGGRHHMPCAIG
eukprot:4191489-Alexandrium_andersonii.AAC.1